jgi:hypothetical protein
MLEKMIFGYFCGFVSGAVIVWCAWAHAVARD